MCKDNFVLHEWQKEKMEALVESERRRNALREGKEEIIKSMLKENLDIELISKISKLDKEEIMKIKESL